MVFRTKTRLSSARARGASALIAFACFSALLLLPQLRVAAQTASGNPGQFSAAATAGTQTPTPSATERAATAPGPASEQAAAAPKKPLPSVPLQPPPAGFDVAGRSQEVLAHLSAVIRYYRISLTPIQKVGEPSDALYRDEAITNAREIGDLAFQSGKAEASLLVAYQKQQAGAQGQQGSEGEAQKLQTARSNIAKRLSDLDAQSKSIDLQLARARPRDLQALRAEKEQIDGQIELNSAMSDALGKIVGMSDTQGRSGLAGDIERLQRTAPELTDMKAKPVSAPLESLNNERSAGVSSQATVLVQLLTSRQAIDHSIQATDALHQQALELRTPLTNIVHSLIAKGQALSDQQAIPVGPAPPAAPAGHGNAAAVDAGQLQQTRETFDSVTATFKVLSAAAVPLSQEIIALEQSRANLVAWRSSVDTEYRSVLRLLLLRILVIAIALGVLFALGEVWRRTATRYIHDLRRRRQLLVMRRIVVSFLSALVVLFGFVTQFNSLATFAGFITAGLAVGLQTILLSVAAYFFIIGRYGVRVGDRITVASVTGDVIEVGLVRFYVMELAGSGTELQQTGRVAVFSNAILFQAGTPLYKQIPGTEYAWHELTVKLQQTANHSHATDAILSTVREVYNGYRVRIEQQHKNLETWMDAGIEAPEVTSRLQLVDGGLQLLVRYPVEIRDASVVDERLTEALLQLMENDEAIKQAVTAPPAIKAAVKG